jgi:hypothetical protein
LNSINCIIDINLLAYVDHLVITTKEGIRYVKDPVRKKNIILQPEEMVRQLLIQWFLHASKISRNALQVEKLVKVNQLLRRFDLVVYGNDVKPKILVECKAPDIVIDQQTFDQLSVYNSVLQAPYVMVTNGINTVFAEMNTDVKMFDFYTKLPDWLVK